MAQVESYDVPLKLAPVRRRGTALGTAAQIVLPLVVAMGVIVVWELWTRYGDVSPLIVPSPLDVGARMIDDASALVPEAWTTLKTILIGFGIATAAGVAMAIAIVAFRPVELTLYPVLVASQVIPKIAIAPIIFIWFGLGNTSRLIVVVLLAFFPVVIATVGGLRAAPTTTLYLARSLGAGKAQTFVRFRLPGALPDIFGGLKLAATRSVTGAIIAEFLTPGPGLGRTIFLATAELRPDVALAGVGYLVVIGIGFFFAIAAAERLLLPWHVSVRDSAMRGG